MPGLRCLVLHSHALKPAATDPAPACSAVEACRDLAVVTALLESAERGGDKVEVAAFA